MLSNSLYARQPEVFSAKFSFQDSEADSYVPPKSPGKLSTTWPPSAPEHVAVPPPSDIKSSVARIKTESQEVESFDESLDRFYDVLSDLTSS